MSISFKNENQMTKLSELELRFFYSCRDGSIEEIKKCLDKGVNININIPPCHDCNDSRPLLGLVYYRYRVDILDLFFDRGIDVDHRSLWGATTLINMCELKEYDHARDIIRRGANVNASNDFGYTSLHWVADHTHSSVRESYTIHSYEEYDPSEDIDFFKELVDWGADPYAIYKNCDNKEKTAIDMLYNPECREEIEDYINRGKNIKRSGKNT